MSHAQLATVLLTLSLAVLPGPDGVRGAEPPPPLCPNPIPHEPVVLYEVTGGTLSGSFDYFLSVYSDGTSRLSSYLGGGSSQFTGVDPSEVDDLRQALAQAGALSQCDQPDLTSDTPLQTLTVFRSNPTRRSNTFSWFTSDGDLAEIQSILDAFIGAHFEPPPGGKGS